jgi:hypothetical protein
MIMTKQDYIDKYVGRLLTLELQNELQYLNLDVAVECLETHIVPARFCRSDYASDCENIKGTVDRMGYVEFKPDSFGLWKILSLKGKVNDNKNWWVRIPEKGLY